MLKEFWDDRYGGNDFVYGTEPNRFFKEQLAAFEEPGKLLLPMEGEGRNAVYAAKQGWEVTAFDQSKAGREKALSLAEKCSVNINYMISDAEHFECAGSEYDLVAMIFAHMPRSMRRKFHRRASLCLKKGGVFILEAFSKEQLGKDSGGPQSLKALYSSEDLKKDLSHLEIIMLGETETHLDEGPFHQGEASVVRLIARKIKE